MNADVRDLLLAIEATDGWETKPTSKGACTVYAPDGGRLIVHLTPSDHRSIKNVRSRLRRMGWQPPVNGKKAKPKPPPPPPQETPVMSAPDFRLDWRLAPEGPPPSRHPVHHKDAGTKVLDGPPVIDAYHP